MESSRFGRSNNLAVWPNGAVEWDPHQTLIGIPKGLGALPCLAGPLKPVLHTLGSYVELLGIFNECRYPIYR